MTETQAPSAPPEIKKLLALPVAALYDDTLIYEVLAYEAGVRVPVAATCDMDKLREALEAICDTVSIAVNAGAEASDTSARILVLELCRTLITNTMADFLIGTADASEADQEQALIQTTNLLFGMLAFSLARGRELSTDPNYLALKQPSSVAEPAPPRANPFVEPKSGANSRAD